MSRWKDKSQHINDWMGNIEEKCLQLDVAPVEASSMDMYAYDFEVCFIFNELLMSGEFSLENCWSPDKTVGAERVLLVPFRWCSMKTFIRN